MKLIFFEGRGLPSNSYMLVSGTDAVLIDCSVSADKVQKTLDEYGAALRYILLTHGHFDHIASLDEVRSATGAKSVIHEADAEMLTDGKKNGYSEFFNGDFAAPAADMMVRDGDTFTAGDMEIKFVHTPGHTKGSVCLVCGNYMFTGDTLFAGNVGRTDLFGGNGQKLYESLVRLTKMDTALEIYPGHGGESTLGREIETNYYISDALALADDNN